VYNYDLKAGLTAAILKSQRSEFGETQGFLGVLKFGLD